MYLAIINQATNIVENVIVPPSGSQAYFVAEGYFAVKTATGGIGDIYADGEFIRPQQQDK